MKMRRCLLWLSIIFIIFAINGCATVISSKFSREATNVPFKLVQTQPSAYIGKIVIWGGVIVQTTADSSGSEMIVLNTPANNHEPPKSSEYADGRFIAKTTEFLDPAVYKPGKKVTIAGEITGDETRPLSRMHYRYPVLTVKELHIWKKQPYYYYDYYPPMYDPWWGWPGPFYRY